MGKRIISQNRGRGSPTYRSPSHRHKGPLEHVKTGKGEVLKGEVTEILHDPARNAPIAKVSFGNKNQLVLIPEGVSVGEEIIYGNTADIKPGNTLEVGSIPEGVPICNIESRPGSGGNFVRASGVYGTLVAQEPGRTLVKLPSGKTKWLNSKCKATIGVVAGGGRVDKPFLKAGKKYHKVKSKAVKYPRVRGVAMNPVDHPFGGGSHQHPGKSKTVSRRAPHGRKVGSISARRTGKR
ncbi:MAG: 50S ribosomal protein L2 [Halobacteriota archaeon]|nr:50S ribosomal protein L2 [Halobacteriota archaeon]